MASSTATIDTIKISVGITQSTKDWLAEQGETYDIPVDRAIEQLIEESIRMRRFPRIGFREEGPRRRACIRGTRLDIWFIIDTLRGSGREHVVALLEESSRSHLDLDEAIAYYETYSDEIDPYIAKHQQPLEYWQAKYPELNIETIDVE